MKIKPLTFVIITFSVAFLILVGVIALTILNKKTENKNDPFRYAEQQTLGDPDAHVHIVEFGDFKCTGCKTWNEKVLSPLKKEYIDTGKAQFHFINFPFIASDSDLGARAGEAVYIQSADAFWTFYNELYAAQQDTDTEWITEELITSIVKEKLPEVDFEQFQKDLESKAVEEEVEQDLNLRDQLEVPGTPSVYVNGELVNYTYESIKNAVEQELQNAE